MVLVLSSFSVCYESSSLSGTRLNNAKVFAAHLMQDTHKNSPSQQIYMDLFPKMQIKLKPIGEVFFFFFVHYRHGGRKQKIIQLVMKTDRGSRTCRT